MKRKTLNEAAGVEPVQPQKTEPQVDNEVPKELSKREKVKLMHDLTGACEDKRLVELIKSFPNGERIYDIFVAAVDKEIEFIMNGKKEDNKQVSDSLASAARQAEGALNTFRQIISDFHQTPLVQTLDTLNVNLGGRSTATTVQRQPVYENTNRNEIPPEGVDSARSALGIF